MLSVTPKSQPPPLKSNRDGSTGISSEIPTVMQRRTPPRNNDRAALFPAKKRKSVPLNAGFKEPEQENRPVPVPAPILKSRHNTVLTTPIPGSNSLLMKFPRLARGIKSCLPLFICTNINKNSVSTTSEAKQNNIDLLSAHICGRFSAYPDKNGFAGEESTRAAAGCGGGQRRANSRHRQQATNHGQQAANSKQRTADGGQRAANSKERAADGGQQTANSGQEKAGDRRCAADFLQGREGCGDRASEIAEFNVSLYHAAEKRTI